MSDDEIYVDIVPRLDENAANEIETSLKEKFKNATQDVGGDFFDAIKNSDIGDEVLGKLGEKLGQAISDPLKGIGDELGLDLQGPLEKVIKQDLSGALDDVMGQFGSKLGDTIKGPLHDITDSIGVDLDSAIEKALKKDWGGLATDLGKGVGGKLTDALGINDLLGPEGLDGVMDKVHTVADAIEAFKGGGGLTGGLHAAAGIFGAGTDSTLAAGPLGDVSSFFGDVSSLGDQLGHGGISKVGSLLGGGAQILNNFFADDAPDKSLGDSIGEILEHAGIGAGVGAGIGNVFDATGIPEILGALIGGGSSLLHNWDSIGHNLFGSAPKPQGPRDTWAHPLYASVFGNAPTSFGTAGDESGTGSLYSGDTGSMFLGGGGGGSSNTTANVAEVEAGSAVVQAGSVSIAGSISLPAGLTAGLTGGGSSHPSAGSPSGIGHGGAGDSGSMASLYSGPSILGKGFAQGGILPGDSPGYDNMIGVLPSGSAVGLEGGEGVLNPRAMSKPGVADLVKSLNNHFDGGTTSVPMDPQNPSLFVPPTQGNKAGGGAPPQQAQLGTGSGAGISGGGIIGAAEQAAVSAAGIAGFGGGAIAAQMAEQEINLAIQKTSQAAAALAAAPFETFGLAGGQMGAPTVNVMGGWAGKLISGALGQMNQIPNVAGGAGSVQPPKQPKQPGEEEQPGQGEKVSMGPKGSKDDPMHVNVTNQPQAPQGGVTSAANMTATMAPLTA